MATHPRESIRGTARWGILAGTVLLALGIWMSIAVLKQPIRDPLNFDALLALGCVGAGLAMFFNGLWNGLQLWFKRSIHLTCPFCHNHNTLLIDKKLLKQSGDHLTRVCEICLAPYFFKIPEGESDIALTAMSCRYCEAEHVVSEQLGGLSCPDCGVRNVMAGGAVDTRSETATPCESCGEPVPDGAYYCKSCSHLARTDFADDYAERKSGEERYWRRVGKKPHGHLVYARAVSRMLKRELSDLRIVDDRHATSSALLDAVDDITVSLEVASTEPKLHPNVADSIGDLDRVYSLLLWKIGHELQTFSILSGEWFKESEVARFRDDFFVGLRNKVVGMLAGERSEREDGSPADWELATLRASEGEQTVRSWREKLFEFDYTLPAVSYPLLPAPEKKARFLGVPGILEEAARIWPPVKEVEPVREQ